MEKDGIFEMAERYVEATGRSVFLTGKAGTGKTTFLKYITRTTSKRFVVLAPTGVAAVNAGGSTIHSFFLLPLCPYLPDVKELVTEYQMPGSYRGLRKDRIKIIRTLDLLIIDEVSMVRADLMDAVDMTLRRIRRNDRPFGGVQLLMIGDVQQLSPVVKDSERQYISQVYPSPYFFHSKALRELQYVTIEFEKVYRQKDREFLDMLNAVRENRVTRDILQRLNSRAVIPGADEESGDASAPEPIRLTTHNRQADAVNDRKLASLPGEAFMCEAEIEGEFPENSYPADAVLTLKKNAQVMFLKNDPEGRFYNGKIGRVKSIAGAASVIVEDGDGTEINVGPVQWENTRYALDETSGEIRPEVIGTFRQLPLRIAWAITIHKSQGLTFDKVRIDAGSAFAFGQVYVALSRCRTLEGITLESPLRASVIYSDSDVSDFNRAIPSAEALQAKLAGEERSYRYSLLKEIFSFDSAGRNIGWLRKVWREHLLGIYPDEYREIEAAAGTMDGMISTGSSFRAQLSRIEASGEQGEDFLKERLGKAAAYFKPLLEGIRDSCLRFISLEIDNRENAKKVREACAELLTGLEISCRTMDMILTRGFSAEGYSGIRTDCLLEDRARPVQRKLKRVVKAEGEGSVVNADLRERLSEWRAAKFKQENIPAYMVMFQETLLTIASLVPMTMEDLLSIKGLGPAKCRKYGEEILAICREYSDSKSEA